MLISALVSLQGRRDVHFVSTEHETEGAVGNPSGSAEQETAVAVSTDSTVSTLNRYRLAPPPADAAARSRQQRLEDRDQANKAARAATPEQERAKDVRTFGGPTSGGKCVGNELGDTRFLGDTR